MSPLEIDKARDRIHNLRARLSDTCTDLESIAKRAHAQDNETRNRMRAAIVAIHTVIEDLHTVCSDHLNDPKDDMLQHAATARAGSEVASGEFDSQG